MHNSDYPGKTGLIHSLSVSATALMKFSVAVQVYNDKSMFLAKWTNWRVKKDKFLVFVILFIVLGIGSALISIFYQIIVNGFDKIEGLADGVFLQICQFLWTLLANPHREKRDVTNCYCEK